MPWLASSDIYIYIYIYVWLKSMPHSADNFFFFFSKFLIVFLSSSSKRYKSWPKLRVKKSIVKV